MSEWSFVVPGNPPALNTTYHVVKVAGKMRLAKHSEVAAWQEGVAYITRGARPNGWQPSRRVRITIDWWAARKRDADAGLKALLDGIAVGLGIDDSCFLPTVRSNEVDKTNPRTIVSIQNEE